MSEQRFEYKVENILKECGFVVINCATSKPFDLIAFRLGQVYLIEVKGRNTQYLNSQKRMQSKLAKRAGVTFIVIEQLKEKNGNEYKIKLSFPITDGNTQLIITIFRKWL